MDQSMNAISTQLKSASFANRPNDELRQHFTQFVGETFYGQMIKAMRSTVGKPAYFHGGRGEEVFRAQLDQTLSQHMTAATADRFADPMFQRQFPKLSVE
jgi:Rod binding domain-containing protein